MTRTVLMGALSALLFLVSGQAFAATLVISGNSTPVNGSGDQEDSAVDGYIRQVAPTTNYDTTNPIQTTKYGSGDHAHSLIKFNLGTVSGMSITSATLYLYKAGGENTHTVSAFRLKRDWVGSETTWNIYSTGNNWGTAGAANTTSDIDGVATDAVSPTSNSSWWSWDVTADVADFASGAETNYGWKLERTDGQNDSTFIQWHGTSEIGDTQPELVVVYEVPSGGTIPVLHHQLRNQ